MSRKPFSFRAAFVRCVDRKVPGDPLGRVYGDLVVEALFTSAFNFNLEAFKLLLALEGCDCWARAQRQRRAMTKRSNKSGVTPIRVADLAR